MIVGDFNYPNIDWEQAASGSRQALEFLDAIGDSFLTQHVNFPSHDCGNILDLVHTNIPNKITLVTDCGKLGNSDHNIIVAEMDLSASICLPKHTIWNCKLAKLDEMRKIFQDIP